MMMSQNLRQQPHPDLFPPRTHSPFHHGLPLRTAQINSQRLNSLNSSTSSPDFDPAHYSSSPASTLASSPATVNQEYSDCYSDYYMPHNQLHNRAQFASPRSANAPNAAATSADSTSGFPASAWPASHDAPSHLAPQQPPRSRFPAGTFHRRNNSDSSVVTPAPSPYGAAAAYPHIVDTDLSQYPSEHGLDLSDQYPQATYAKSLPPSATGAAFTETFYDFSPNANNAADFLLFQQAIADGAMSQQSGGDGQQPLLLPRQHSTASGELEDDSRTQIERGRLPKLNRTISDICQDELYNPGPSGPAATAAASLSHPAAASSPRRDLFAERLQAAHHDHLAAARAPLAAGSRGRSPFQPGSAAYVESATPAFADPAGLEQPGSAKTVSPQDVQNMEYDGPDDDAPAAWFPHAGLGGAPGAKREPALEAAPVAAAAVRSQVLQQYPFSRRRPAPAADAPPEFHASLTSMESTKSEPAEQGPASTGAPASPAHGSSASSRTPPRPSPAGRARKSVPASSRGPSSASSSASTSTPETPIQRPASTASDAGTYTCTYHGCPQRFETPALLQRHKRDGHRQPTPGSAASAASAAADSAMSSQAGPHRCDRVNPATGRPCRSVFSRPYDLTRHEDTIHNARRTKARCPLCAEDKTFSRGDALTRHMRVVHPDVDFPGKHKRKGGS